MREQQQGRIDLYNREMLAQEQQEVEMLMQQKRNVELLQKQIQ